MNERGLTVIRQPDWQEGEGEFQVNTYLIRDKNPEVGKFYEFLGEIEEVSATGVV
jgi:hypothetical protein